MFPEQHAGRSLSKSSPRLTRNSAIATLREELLERELSFLRCERNEKLQGRVNPVNADFPRGLKASVLPFLTPKSSSPYGHTPPLLSGSCPSYQAPLTPSKKPSWIHQVQLPRQWLCHISALTPLEPYQPLSPWKRGADTRVVNCEAGCGVKPKIGPVHQTIAEMFISGPIPWGKTTVSERLQEVAGLV